LPPTLHTQTSRKRSLLRHLHATRQRLLRLHVVTAWSSKANAMANVARVLDVCGRHTDALRDAADQLAYLHAELGSLQARIGAMPWLVPCASSAVASASGAHIAALSLSPLPCFTRWPEAGGLAAIYMKTCGSSLTDVIQPPMLCSEPGWR
jgi:hypothetical protein